MRVRSAVGALCALMTVALSAAPGSADHQVTGRYTTGTVPGVGVVCSPNCLGENGLNIGGYTFPAAPEPPVRVTIADASRGPVSFTICQDLNAALCGESGEPRLDGCATTANLSTSAVPFQAGRPTSVLIRTAGPTQPAGCVGTALGGTITLTYGP